MKPMRFSFPAAIVAAVLAVQSYAATVAGQEAAEMRNALDKELARLELIWQPGHGRDYYIQAGKIADGLQAQERVAANAAALSLLNAVQAKRPVAVEDSLDTGVTDLAAMTKLAHFLLAQDNMPIEQRQQKMRLLSKLLGQVRREIVPNYVWQRVVMNVAPPAGVAGMAGMDPEAIRDPVARKQYQAAILDNQSKSLGNSRQQALRRMEEELARPIVDYLSAAARPPGALADTVRQSVAEARLTETEKAEVIQLRRN